MSGVGPYGWFDDEAREYVITRPDTPLPWINYLGSEDLFGLISNTGGGYTFFRDARLRRLTRYRYNNAPTDVGGRYLYLRDEATGAFWSPTWQPVRAELDDYRCRHGLGATTISSRRGPIAAEVLYTVPLGHDTELWRLRVTNQGDEPARLSVFSFVEFCLWDAWDDATNFQRNFSTGEVEVHGSTIYHLTEYRERRDHFAWFACSEHLAGFDTQREAFLGPYGSLERPAVVVAGQATGSMAHGWAPIGSHHVTLEVPPGGTREVRFGLGYFENPRSAKFDPPGTTTLDRSRVDPVVAELLAPGRVDQALVELRAHWDDLLDRLQVATPDEHVDRVVDIWNPYQCMTTFNLSRSASSYESGVGRGMGFRDCCQDLLGFVHLQPERARQRLLDVAATQLPTGGAYHQYQPLTKQGNDAIGSGFNDDPLWLVLAAAAYVKETGDVAVLDHAVAFDGDPHAAFPLHEHLRRSLGYTLERRGPHGLPLIGRADWNDCLNLNCFSDEPGESFQLTEHGPGGVAESVFIAGLFALVADELADLAGLRGADDEAAEHRAAGAAMRDVVRAHGWDGAWFRRAYDHFGTPVGSAANQEGRIFLEPQGMCVMGGIGLDDGTARQALDSVAEHLVTPHGILLLQPAYSRYHRELGEITSYPPGYKENAGIFCHTNPWIAIAEALLGDGDRVLEHHLRINPSARAALGDVHRCEPYVYAQMIAGRDAPSFGEAKNSWLTGTAAWSYVAATQWLLGLRPEHAGLRIDPCLPRAWDGFTAHRRFRGARYEVTVRKAPGTSGRVRRLLVDGRPVEGSIVPAAPAGRTVVVEAQVEP